MKAVKEKAYAKINLYLECIGLRDDGFHDICTVMHAVDLYDTVTVTLLSKERSGIRLNIDGNRRLPSDSRNLVYMAAELFMKRLAIVADISIKLEKEIPVSAGLAGGSTDAAATLRALNRLFDKPMTEKALLSLAAELGSDVPFCLIGGTALCEGRGERMTRLSAVPILYTVIAASDEYVSTPMAYGALDKLYSRFDGTVKSGGEGALDALLAFLSGGVAPSGELYNIFEGAVLPDCPRAREIKSRLSSFGARYAMMSGSGPSVFGIFDTKCDAERARDELLALGFKAFFASSVK